MEIRLSMEKQTAKTEIPNRNQIVFSKDEWLAVAKAFNVSLNDKETVAKAIYALATQLNRANVNFWDIKSISTAAKQ